MANNQDYLDRVKLAVVHMRGCGAIHKRSVQVHEIFRGQTVWQGVVEQFEMIGHAKAKHAYAWSHREGKDDKGERFIAALEIPPVTSPETAVWASIVAEAKKRGKP